MKLCKAQLLAACAASTVISSTAYAQILLPPVELRGAGATTVGDVAVRTFNCIGNPGNHVLGDTANNRLNKYGTNSGTLSTVEPGHYDPTTAMPAFNCETEELQPQFEAKYIGTGSGAGRQMWRNFTTSNLNGTASNINPFSGGAGNPSGWPNLQYAFSEAPATVSDITNYNANANNSTNKAGPAIQIPFFVIPISFAYNPVYGTRVLQGNTLELKYRVRVPQNINGTPAGGLRLKRATYCGIFNGQITNWNDPAIQADNGGLTLRDPYDPLTRWDAEGVPIRLVGRADRSGGTDVFTRAMAAQCNGLGFTNKYEKASESLPYDPTSTIDITRLRSDSNYKPGVSSSNVSGTTQSLGGRVYDRVSQRICNWNEVNNTTKQCDNALAPGGKLTNSPTPGLFLVADGASGVAEAINTIANNALVNSSMNAIKLNGKFGYVGADYTAPVPGRTLFSAALQRGNDPQGGIFVMPSAAMASQAFGSVLPPETTAANGVWAPFVNASTGDQRKLGSVDPYLPIDPSTNPATPVSRANPLHWTAVLYNPNLPVTSTLASPAAGYPVTGSAFMVTYTCFKGPNANVAGNNPKRYGIVRYISALFGYNLRDSANNVKNGQTFLGLNPSNVGVLTQSNTTLPSFAWRSAIQQTFLIKSVQPGNGSTLGNQNLWIQDRDPTHPNHVDNFNHPADSKSNPTCTTGAGA